MHRITRRALVRGSGALVAGTALGAALSAESRSRPARPASPGADPRPLKLAVKAGMVQVEGSLADKLALLRDLGYDGIELDSPGGPDPAEVARARAASGLPVHGVVDSIHWNVRLSDPDADVRERAVAGLETAVRDAHAYGGSSVLLVPGRVADPEKENQQQVWERSIAGIRRVLPVAAELGIHILIENVWNGFCYVHEGPADQSADELARYLDAIASPWVGAYLDLGNHCKYGVVEQWVRTLGRRIVKLDVKDWSRASGWSKIGDGDVNWPAVREALAEIHFTGWCTAEVDGGGEERLRDIRERMGRVLLGE